LAIGRRNYVINRMYEDGYLSREHAIEAYGTPLKLAERRSVDFVKADYFGEETKEHFANLKVNRKPG